MHYIYVLKSLKNNKQYVGLTSKEPFKRLEEHHRGTALWSRRNGPFQLIYQEQYDSKAFAQKREKFLKSGHGREFLKKKLSRLDLLA